MLFLTWPSDPMPEVNNAGFHTSTWSHGDALLLRSQSCEISTAHVLIT